MRPRVLLLALAPTVIGCKTVTTETREPARTVSSEVAPVGAAVADAGAGAAPMREEPLAWGTRPPSKGPLYPIVDGMCIHGEIWPTKGSALYSYGNGTGAWTRGDVATVARLVDDGIESI